MSVFEVKRVGKTKKETRNRKEDERTEKTLPITVYIEGICNCERRQISGTFDLVLKKAESGTWIKKYGCRKKVDVYDQDDAEE